MATIYLKRKSEATTVKSTDGAEHPNAVLVLDDTSVQVGKYLSINANYYRTIEDYNNGATPIQYLSTVSYSFNEHTETTYEYVITNFIDVNISSGEIALKNEHTKTAILEKLDANGEKLSVNWEFPI